MARTNVNDLKKILDDSALAYSTLSAYIDSANVFVTATLTGQSLSTALLTEIEKWIAAHMVTITRERVAKKEGAGGAFIEYAGEWGRGLASTSYGQMAINLDTSETLQALADGKRTATSRAIISFDDSELLA